MVSRADRCTRTRDGSTATRPTTQLHRDHRQGGRHWRVSPCSCDRHRRRRSKSAPMRHTNAACLPLHQTLSRWYANVPTRRLEPEDTPKAGALASDVTTKLGHSQKPRIGPSLAISRPVQAAAREQHLARGRTVASQLRDVVAGFCRGPANPAAVDSRFRRRVEEERS
jgi:hypothetical protein